ncbi:hypothetical protein DFH07DRAFT_26918 [Mycena maculata]|uniref:Zn(2)-C6 fungal-type domain-containing protein n=1 Tax=Mycena maculata TaxID=230809 RepID=A0AAD7N3A9_9AGAR|nr:hypothetical protein DFH07DRAFT_26918 [Mycena maculata]
MADSTSNALLLNRRRRAMIACTNCRKRKIKCVTTEEPPRRPCARCTKRNLGCEYIAVELDDYSTSPAPESPVSPSSTYPLPPNPSYPNPGVPSPTQYYSPPNTPWDPAQPRRPSGYPTPVPSSTPGYGQLPAYGANPYGGLPGYPNVAYGYPPPEGPYSVAPATSPWPQSMQQQPRCECPAPCSVCHRRR